MAAAFRDVIGNLPPAVIWEFEGAMEIVNYEPNYDQVGASGECPHCHVRSYFRPVATHREQTRENPGLPPVTILVSAAKCESCKRFVLVIATSTPVLPNYQIPQPPILTVVYPIGKPNDDIAVEVPQDISEDFKEALRCHWIQAYKACVVMCGRAIQASAIALGAEGNQLIDQIDDLFGKGRITGALKDFAHIVRITRNIGAHPDKDGLKDVTERDAEDVIEFTREFLHHIYVMPAKLEARRPKSSSPVASPVVGNP